MSGDLTPALPTSPPTPAGAGRIYLPPRMQWLAGIILALSNFMVILDLSIANVSVPHIAGNLGISLDQGTWIITSYAVAEAICVPLTGWLAQRFGTVRVFLGSMFGFCLFSLLCGLSTTLGMLVACRIGQGLCGGPIMPMSQTLLTAVFPPEKRGMAIAMWAMTVTMGPAFGPIIGGAITDNWSWHWIFLINVPIGIAAVFFGYLLLRQLETPTRKLPIDRVGLFLMVFWIGCLQIMLDIGRDHDWFGDWKIVMLAVLAFVGFCVFIIWELTEKHPAVDLRVFRHRGYWSSVVAFSLCFGAYFSSIVVIPQWLQVTMGYTATQAGFVTALSAMAAMFGAPVAAKLMPIVDARVMVSGAVVWMALTSYMRTFWFSGVDIWAIGVPILLQGAAIPFLMIPLTNMSMVTVLPEEMASGAGLQNFTRTMAIAVSTSIVLTIWGNHQRIAREDMVSSLRADEFLAQMKAEGFSGEQAQTLLTSMVEREAVTMAANHTFMVAAVVLLCAGAVMWLSPRVKMTAMMGGDAPVGH